ncbi:VOC family protein [Colwellia echini]|uniref:VOC family protein n=1 Tax=Colwellia echini TaxID=1982103 RepID=A0ABY3N1E3_9GAMM|nr:VOC family protein [Colwellia echini]TYK67305.1 VOC family protein [Colwellia echini]
MYLEHINLTVNDIDDTLAFYKAAFPNWVVRGEGEQTWYGKSRRWLHFGDDDQYLTFCSAGEGKARDLAGHQIGLAHFAYVVTNLSAMQARLLAAGFKLDKKGPEDPYRSNIYYIDPNGIEVEFVQYHSDLPEQRNAY